MTCRQYRQDYFANKWEAALQYYQCFAEGYNEEAEKGIETPSSNKCCADHKSDIPKDQTDVLVPALMNAATSDGCSPLTMVESMQSKLKDGKLVVIEGDHVFLDHPTQFGEELEIFFNERGFKAQKWVRNDGEIS